MKIPKPFLPPPIFLAVFATLAVVQLPVRPRFEARMHDARLAAKLDDQTRLPGPPDSLSLPEGSQDLAAEVSLATARPLFLRTRRPFADLADIVSEPEIAPIEVAEPEPLAPPSPPPELKFLGMMTREGEPRVLLRIEETGEERWSKVGEAIAGWSLAETDGMQLRFTRGTEYFLLKLYK